MRDDSPTKPRPRPPEFSQWSEHAQLVFEERMAAAEQLNLPAWPGTEAWRVAMVEARRVQERKPSNVVYTT
jgi:hypothetical protein